MENKKEMTAPNVSVGADTEQPIQKIAENSIYEYEENIKRFEEMQREMQLSLDCSTPALIFLQVLLNWERVF